MRCRWLWALILVSSLSATVSGWGDTPDVPVARVSLSSGDACYLRGDDPDGGWAVLAVNTPLMEGDSVYAPEGSRVEIDLGLGNVVRLDSATQLDLVSLTQDVVQLGLSMGRVNLRVRGLPKGYTLEVDTPQAAASVAQMGSYRALVRDDTTDFDVLSGGLSAAANGEETSVYAGETLEVTARPSLKLDIYEAPAPDAFDRWSEARDAARDVSESARYVDQGVLGYEDLDSSGDWIEDSEYGNVWVPAGVSQEWAPYSDGAWIWQDPYGWTWVANEPWGWAPFHYGRWVFVSGVWAWVPPPGRGQGFLVLYAPALVGFIGGPGWGFGIGWVPLAPGELYCYPWQPVPVRSTRYRNITVFNGVTVIEGGQFGRARPVPRRLDSRLVMKAPTLGTVLSGVQPTRASLTPHPERRPSLKALPPAAAVNRTLVARLVPPPAPVSFSRKLEEIKVTGKPVAKPVLQAPSSGKPFVMGTSPAEGSRVTSAYAPLPGAVTPRPAKESRVVQKRDVDAGRAPSPPPRSTAQSGLDRGSPPSRPEPGVPGPRSRSSPRVITLPVSPSPREASPPGASAQQGHGTWTPRPAPQPKEREAPRSEPTSGTTGNGTTGRPTATPRESAPPAQPGQPSGWHPPASSPPESRHVESPTPVPTPQPRVEPPQVAPRQEPVKPAPADSAGSQPKKSDSSK